jgi:Transposase DDE domain
LHCKLHTIRNLTPRPPCSGYPSRCNKEDLDADGRVERVVEWFGDKLHLLVDVRHEVALAYRITAPTVGDHEMIRPLLDPSRPLLPERRIESLAYDKAADDEEVHQALSAAGIKPLIEDRALWETEPERMLPGHTGRSNVVDDEAGTISCSDEVSTPMVRRRTASMGHEPKRGTRKSRCPARHEGRSCPSDARCKGAGRYGMVVRIKSALDLRRFPPIPRDPAVRAVIRGPDGGGAGQGSPEALLGADDGNVVGARRFHAMVGVVMPVHLATATMLARGKRAVVKTLGGIRLVPIARTLNEQVEQERAGTSRHGLKGGLRDNV